VTLSDAMKGLSIWMTHDCVICHVILYNEWTAKEFVWDQWEKVNRQ
jgi:hypothetical protein